MSLYVLYKIPLTRAIFYLPSLKCTHIGERASISFPHWTNHYGCDLNDAIIEVYRVFAPQGHCAPDSMCPMVESCSPCVELLCPNHAPLCPKGNQGADISFKWVKPSVIGLKHSNSMKCWHPGMLLPNIDIVEMSFLSVNLVRHIKSVHEWLKVILNFCSDISNVHMW